MKVAGNRIMGYLVKFQFIFKEYNFLLLFFALSYFVELKMLWGDVLYHFG